MGAYDASKNLLNSIVITNKGLLPSVNATSLGFYGAAAYRENAVPTGGGDLYIHSVKVVLDTDIDDLPPLP